MDHIFKESTLKIYFYSSVHFRRKKKTLLALWCKWTRHYIETFRTKMKNKNYNKFFKIFRKLGLRFVYICLTYLMCCQNSVWKNAELANSNFVIFLYFNIHFLQFINFPFYLFFRFNTISTVGLLFREKKI